MADAKPDSPNLKTRARSLLVAVKDRGAVVGGTVAVMWIVQVVNWILGGRLDAYGVQPRSVSGLLGILFAPFLHGSFTHLIGNTWPFLLLGMAVALERKRNFLYVAGISALIGGLGTWLIGPAASVHVGASGVVFGFLGYLLSRGIFERKPWPIIAGLATLFYYGGVLTGVVPGDPHISWQMHLFGLLGGIVSARILSSPNKAKAEPKKRIAPDKKRVAPIEAPDDPPRLAARAELEHDADVEAELEALRRRKA